VGAILALAIAFRFATIEGKSFWFDEAYSAQLASKSVPDLLTLVRVEDTHPPLYYLLLSVWGRIFGTGDTAIRSLSAVASIFAVAGTWWIGRRLGGPAVGALAAFLTAVAPFQIFAAQEARMYALLGLFTLLSWSALLLATDGRRGAWSAYVIITTFALYTHYFALLNLVGHGIYVLAVARPHWRTWLLSQLAVGVLYAPWLPSLLSTYNSGRGWPFIRPPLGLETVTQFLVLLSIGGHAFGLHGWFGAGSASIAKQATIVIPFVALAVLGAVAAKKDARAVWFLVAYLLVPVAVAYAFSVRHNIFYARYFSFVFPPYAILSAFGILAVAGWLPGHLRRATVLTWALVLLLVFSQALHEAYANPAFDMFNWRRAAGIITAEAGPTDLVAITPSFGNVPFSRYFHGPQRVVPMAPYEFTDPSGQGRVLAPAAPKITARAEFQAFAKDHEVLWLVLTIPFTRAAFGRLSNVFAGIYDARMVEDLRGIIIFKMIRHSP